MQLLKDQKFEELCEALNRRMKLDVAYWVCAFSVTWNTWNIGRNAAGVVVGTWDVGRAIAEDCSWCESAVTDPSILLMILKIEAALCQRHPISPGLTSLTS